MCILRILLRTQITMALFLWGGCQLLAASPPTSYVFLIDTSGSMVGLPVGSNAANIFPQVKAEVVRYIKDLQPSDRIDIVTFDSGIQSSKSLEIADDESKRQMINYVEQLEAKGSQTWVYQSILDKATQVITRNKVSGAPEIPTIFYVFTDGRDNAPDGIKMAEMLKRFATLRRHHDFLYYVALGVNLPPEDIAAFEAHPSYTNLVQAPTGEVVRLGTIRARVKALNFGVIEGDVSQSRSLALQAINIERNKIKVRLEAQFEDAEKAGCVVEFKPDIVNADTGNQVRLNILNRESLPEASYTGILHLFSEEDHAQIIPNSIPVTFTTIPTPMVTLALPNGIAKIDFGRASSEQEGKHPQALIQAEFSNSAVAEKKGIRVKVVPQEPGGPTPTLTWEGRTPNPNQPLTAEDGIGDLQLSWPTLPTQPGIYAGMIEIAPLGMHLQGPDGLKQTRENTYLIPYNLTLDKPPRPHWLTRLLVLVAASILLGIVMLFLWLRTGQPPWKLTRSLFLRFGLVRPRLRGKLVSNLPPNGRQELHLKGLTPVLIGRDGTEWQNLPDQFQVRPRLRQNREAVIASSRSGNISFRVKGQLNLQPLAERILEHQDVLILSDNTEITFLDHDRH